MGRKNPLYGEERRLRCGAPTAFRCRLKFGRGWAALLPAATKACSECRPQASASERSRPSRTRRRSERRTRSAPRRTRLRGLTLPLLPRPRPRRRQAGLNSEPTGAGQARRGGREATGQRALAHGGRRNGRSIRLVNTTLSGGQPPKTRSALARPPTATTRPRPPTSAPSRADRARTPPPSGGPSVEQQDYARQAELRLS